MTNDEKLDELARDISTAIERETGASKYEPTIYSLLADKIEAKERRLDDYVQSLINNMNKHALGRLLGIEWLQWDVHEYYAKELTRMRAELDELRQIADRLARA